MTVITVAEDLGTVYEFVYRNTGGLQPEIPAYDVVLGSEWTLLPDDGKVAAADGDNIIVAMREKDTNKTKKAGSTAAVVVQKDTTAPVFIEGYPSAGNIGITGLTLFTQMDEAGTVYYAVYAGDAAEPSIEVLEAEGIAVDVPDSEEISIDINGLQADTYYNIYVIAEDKKGNLQTGIVRLSVITAK
jgi:hypothetical protein